MTITKVYQSGRIGDICKLIHIDHKDEDITYLVRHPKMGEIWCKNIRKATQEEIDSLDLPKLYTIQDLADGHVALINEDHPDVEKILSLAFPKDINCFVEQFKKYLTW